MRATLTVTLNGQEYAYQNVAYYESQSIGRPRFLCVTNWGDSGRPRMCGPATLKVDGELVAIGHVNANGYFDLMENQYPERISEEETP